MPYTYNTLLYLLCFTVSQEANIMPLSADYQMHIAKPQDMPKWLNQDDANA